MSIITDALPCSVEYGGVKFAVNTDFRLWLGFENLMTGKRFTPENLAVFLSRCYLKLPPDINTAVQLAVGFYVGAKEDAAPHKTGKEESKKRVYDFDYDADYIYAAFLSQYGVDLTTVMLHWYQFKALFSALSEDCKIVQIMQYRRAVLSEIKDKDQRAFYRKMQNLYRLPDMRTEEEKEQDMLSALDKLF